MKLFKKAILIVHGFAGGTYDQEYLAHELQLKENYDVFTYTLPGHDGDIKDKISYQDWINKSESEMDFLIKNGYTNIYVIGHSMGGVIASYLASKYKQVKKLVLVAPAFRIFGFEKGNFNLDTSLEKTQKIFEQYGSVILANRIFKLPANCYIEFAKLIKTYNDCPKNINIPTLLIRGTNDNVVPEEAVEHAYNMINNNYKKIVHLEGITHDVFREEKKDILSKIIIKFFDNQNSLFIFKDTL